MNTMKQWMSLVKQLTLLTQFGLSFITPLLMCLGICWLLCEKAFLGSWVFIPGFFFGLGGSAMVAWKLYVSVIVQEQKKKKERRVSYNRHE